MKPARILLQFDTLNYTTVFIMFFSIVWGLHLEYYAIRITETVIPKCTMCLTLLCVPNVQLLQDI